MEKLANSQRKIYKKSAKHRRKIDEIDDKSWLKIGAESTREFIDKFFELHEEIKIYMRIPHVIDYMRPQLHAESCNLHADCDYMRRPHVKLHAD